MVFWVSNVYYIGGVLCAGSCITFFGGAMSDVSIAVSVSRFGEPLVNQEAFLDEGRVVVRIEQGEDVVGVSMNSLMARWFASRLVEAAVEAEGIERAREARREDRNE